MGEEVTKRVDQQEESGGGGGGAAHTDFTAGKKSINNNSSQKAHVPFLLQDSVSVSNQPRISERDDAVEYDVGKTVGKSKDKIEVAREQVEMEKRLALIKAWEENEKTIAHNKAYKKLSAVDAWENTKRASVEAELKQIEENFEKKKAACAEKIKNKVTIVRKAVEEKKAMIEADRGKEFLMVEEAAAKFRATDTIPKKLFAYLGCTFAL